MKRTAVRYNAMRQNFQEYWKQSEGERIRFRKALDNGLDAFQGLVSIQDGEGNEVPPVILNFFVPLKSRIEAKCFDESPEITYPREATGDEMIADGIGRLLSRITEEGELPAISRDQIASVMTEGGYGVVYGMPNLPDAMQVNERSKGTGAIIEQVGAAVKGEAELPVPVPGQDHDQIAQVIQETTLDPINLAANPPELTDALTNVGAAHLEAKAKEDKSQNYWRYEDNHFYFEPVDISRLAWDLTYGDPKRGSWLMHCIEMSLDEAKSHPAFKPSVRSRLVVSVPDEREGYIPIKVEGEGEDENKAANGVVRIWAVYDKATKKRHYVPEALESGEVEFLEVDDRNPYLDDSGNPLLPWFWPVAVYLNGKRNQRGPLRSLPTPYMRNGWDQQIESIKFDTALLEGTKAALAIKYLADSQLPVDTLKALASGRVNVVVQAPPGLENKGTALTAVQWQAPLQEAYAERERQLGRFCIAARFPLAAFTSQPQADTLGQEEIGQASGNDALFDLGRMLECFYAEIVQGVLLIAGAKMPPEVVAEYMGVELEAQWDAWRHASRRGGRVRVKFAPTTREMNPQRAQQLMGVVTAASTMINVTTGFPMVDPGSVFRVFNEACKTLGVGAMEQLQVTPEMLLNQQKPNDGPKDEKSDSDA